MLQRKRLSIGRLHGVSQKTKVGLEYAQHVLYGFGRDANLFAHHALPVG